MSRSPLPPVLFEDQAIIAFNKPSGLLIAPDRWDKSLENLMQLIHQHRSPDIFNAHRLDKDTSGLVLCAKNKPALEHLCHQFEQHTLTKRYLAMVRPVPAWKNLTVELGLEPNEREPGRMRTVRKGGKPAITRFTVLETWRSCALVEAFPETGRTHQIRVHLASTGSPVTGDPLYGDGRFINLSAIKPGYQFKKMEQEKPLLGRLGLHAESLTFQHPETHMPMTIKAPTPADFELAIKYLTRFHSP